MNVYHVFYLMYSGGGPLQRMTIDSCNFHDAEKQVLDKWPTADIREIRLVTRGLVPHDLSSGCCES